MLVAILVIAISLGTMAGCYYTTSREYRKELRFHPVRPL